MTEKGTTGSDAPLSALEKQLAQLRTHDDDPARLTLQRQIAAARTEHNARRPLTKLSPELVRRIFELLQQSLVDAPKSALALAVEKANAEWGSDDEDDDDASSDGERPFLLDGWMAFAKTCSWTRKMALAFPDLWTRIDCSSRERAVRSAERAGDVPLALYLPPDAEGRAVAFLAEHFPRARELVYHEPALVEEERQHETRFIGLLNGACPRLEALTLVDYHTMGPYLSGTYENLRSLVIDQGEYCPEPNTVIRLPGLRSLTLKSLYIDDGIFSLITLLQSLPALEDLQLVDLDECTRRPRSIRDLDDDIDLNDSTWKVALPKLKRLVIKNDLRTVAVFVRILPLPSAHLSLVVASNDGEDGSSGIGKHLDPFYEHEIVSRARAFWKAAAGKEAFDEGTFRADVLFDHYWVTWAGSAEGASVRVSTPMDPEATLALDDCTVLEWAQPVDEIWEPMGAAGPVLTGVRKVVLKRADDFFPRGMKALEVWLKKQRAAGRRIDTVEFVKCPPDEERNARGALHGLGVTVLWTHVPSLFHTMYHDDVALSV